MKTTISSLTTLEIGHIHTLEEESVAGILTELPNEQISVAMNDTTAFIFHLNDKYFTLINTGCCSIAIRTC
ncbi:hypothetical protein [Escherichia fergusonii]|uniref:hypothetical protein n=1 Tax=Escherichia fergusonii TaxID=564 RepID=UPI00061466A0|nr:hypothetical protein [Escherichia fergusonii]KWW08245.1 hypothetical protein VL22_0201265 [Escherichia fergusonii]